MRYFLDTEFIERPNTIDLISIGIKAEDGREYSAIHNGYKYDDADDWVKQNVIWLLYLSTIPKEDRDHIDVDNFQLSVGKSIPEIRKEILKFVGFPDYKKYNKPVFYGYYCNYDWVTFCWIFGKMIDLPKGFPRYCIDLKQIMDMFGLTKEGLGIQDPIDEHDTLADARWNFELFKLVKQELDEY